MKNTRSLLIKIGSLVVILGVAVLMFIIGRGHTVYFDNKTFEAADGTTVETAYRVEVYVNGERVAKLAKRERGMATWIGQNFEMDLVVTQNKGDEEVKELHYEIKLPYGMDGAVINLNALLAEYPQSEYMTEFVPIPSAAEEEEEVVITDDPGFGDI